MLLLPIKDFAINRVQSSQEEPKILLLSSGLSYKDTKSSRYKVNPFESVGGVSRGDVVMNQFIFLLSCYRTNHSFNLNLESD